ncbi:30S ribosomal protein S17 [Candidatus Micrarchaeota archaeon]|nr:30S ribosomal protein S17 [Candidatus Micrarchaeota archaeon]
MNKNIVTRGSVRIGKVTSLKAKKTATVVIDYVKVSPKYERREKRRSKIHAHIPDGMELNLGDKVEIAETRKISKTKAHVITKILK